MSSSLADAKAGVDLIRIVSETLALNREGRVYVGLCPFHGERTPSFTVYPDHFHCFGCGASGDVFDWLDKQRGMGVREARRYLGAPDSGMRAAPVQPRPKPRNESNVRLALDIWAEGLDPLHSIVADYLRGRGVELPPEPVIRYHPRCPCRDDRLPAMIALMTDPLTGQPVGVHRTFLKPDGSGKAEIAKSKMMLGQAGVIRLYERLTDGLGLAEGIEKSLAVAQRVGWGPVWSAGASGGIQTFPVIPCTTLNIFSDRDAAGLLAARECADRWAEAGAEVLIHVPPDGVKDWDDATRGIGS